MLYVELQQTKFKHNLSGMMSSSYSFQGGYLFSMSHRKDEIVALPQARIEAIGS
jgi:hypothetical protein